MSFLKKSKVKQGSPVERNHAGSNARPVPYEALLLSVGLLSSRARLFLKYDHMMWASTVKIKKNYQILCPWERDFTASALQSV